MRTKSPLVGRVADYIRDNSLLSEGNTVIVGTSGGIDSTSLLRILHSLTMDLTLVAVYADHGLRPAETKAERLFIEQLAGKLKIGFEIIELDVRGYQQHNRCSTEEAARLLRYRGLEDVRKKYQGDVIAVGHTCDDQVEEFFIRLLRGTGMKGLSGMGCRRDRIIRPLLNETKSHLVDYLEQIGQAFCHDSTNDSTSFLRNDIRHNLLPHLEKEYNPSLRSTVLQEMAILRQDEDFLDAAAEKRFRELCSIKAPAGPKRPAVKLTFHCGDFTFMHISIQRRLIEKICWVMGSKPSFRIIEQLRLLAESGRNGSRLHLHEGLRCRKEQGLLIFEFPKGKKKYRGEDTPETVHSLVIDKPGQFHVPELHRILSLTSCDASDTSILPAGTLCLDEKNLDFPLTLRAPLPGEKMKALGAPGSKKVTRILQDMKIPAAMRSSYPVLADRIGPVAIVGVKIADRMRITEDTRRWILIRWEQTPEPE